MGRVIPTIAALAAAYATWPRWPSYAAIEAVFDDDATLSGVSGSFCSSPRRRVGHVEGPSPDHVVAHRAAERPMSWTGRRSIANRGTTAHAAAGDVHHHRTGIPGRYRRHRSPPSRVVDGHVAAHRHHRRPMFVKRGRHGPGLDRAPRRTRHRQPAAGRSHHRSRRRHRSRSRSVRAHPWVCSSSQWWVGELGLGERFGHHWRGPVACNSADGNGTGHA